MPSAVAGLISGDSTNAMLVVKPVGEPDAGDRGRREGDGQSGDAPARRIKVVPAGQLLPFPNPHFPAISATSRAGAGAPVGATWLRHTLLIR
jgi:hypothetical protein